MAISLSFTVGIGLASFLIRPAAFWLVLACACLISLALAPLLRRIFARIALNFLQRPQFGQVAPAGSSRIRAFRLVLLCLACFFLGAARYQAAQPVFSDSSLAWYNDAGRSVEVVAVVNKPPDVRDTHIQLVLSAEQIVMPDGSRRAVDGQLLVYLPSGGEWHYGDRLRIRGELRTPPEDEGFSYQAYLARQQVYSYMPYAKASLLENGAGNRFLQAIYDFRERGLRLIYQFLPDPEASLLAGIVLGVESGIPQDVDQAFKDTGTTHVIAISG